MVRKIVSIAALAGAVLLPTFVVYASHLGYPSSHIIFGKSYFYTLNLLALITKLTGRDIKDGTQLNVKVKILASDTACSNPQAHVINPGVGPRGDVFLTSDPLNSNNLLKSDRTKSTFSTTASGELVVDPAIRLDQNLGLCKTSSGQGQWTQLFWQDRDCIKAQPSGNTCYTNFAAFVNGVLTYVTGPNTGQPVPLCESTASNNNCGTDGGGTYQPYYGWTFVFLPTQFAMNAFVTTQGAPDPDSNFYWQCQFKPNNEIGAAQPGEPYSISNPPVNGWGGIPPAEYNCIEITQSQYDAL